MTRDSEEYKQFCAEYEAKEKERKDNPGKYPYFAYYQFGFHRMTYITEEELKEAIDFYHLKSDCKGGYFRYGRQPITILPRNDKADKESEEMEMEELDFIQPKKVVGKLISVDVLDKIRAEIEQERSFQRAIDEYDIATGLRKALEIVDKYKAENNSEMLVCPACGLDVHSDFKTCPKCGADMKGGNKRTIDADELLKRIAEKCKTPSLSEDTVNGLCGATAIIYNMLNESGQESEL